jgi:hypothetical protein
VLAINKQLKGGVVNIYPLETLHLVERKELKCVVPDAKPITDYVRLKPDGD